MTSNELQAQLEQKRLQRNALEGQIKVLSQEHTQLEDEILGLLRRIKILKTKQTEE